MSKNNFVFFKKSIYSKTVSNNSFESLRRKRRYCCKIRCSSRTCAVCPVVLDINVERRLVSVKNDCCTRESYLDRGRSYSQCPVNIAQRDTIYLCVLHRFEYKSKKRKLFFLSDVFGVDVCKFACANNGCCRVFVSRGRATNNIFTDISYFPSTRGQWRPSYNIKVNDGIY